MQSGSRLGGFIQQETFGKMKAGQGKGVVDNESGDSEEEEETDFDEEDIDDIDDEIDDSEEDNDDDDGFTDSKEDEDDDEEVDKEEEKVIKPLDSSQNASVFLCSSEINGLDNKPSYERKGSGF